MPEIYWLNPISGNFTNAADWSGHVVPGAADDAIINAVGSNPFTVTASTRVSVNSIQTASDATLSITGGTFTAAEGTGSGANAGIILVAGSGTLAAAGQITNSGSIQIGNGSYAGSCLLNGYRTTLSGGGQIELSGNGKSNIDVAKSAGYAILYNVDNTIAGSGTIGKSSKFFLINDAAGVIDANGAAPLFVYGDTQNNGLVEATGGDSLTFKAGNPSTGVFLAADGSAMRIVGPQLDGVTLVSEGSGVITADNISSNSVKGLTNEANLTLSGYDSFFSNLYNHSSVYIENGTATFYSGCTLSGGGTINLSSRGTMSFSRNGSTLVNADNTILGSGDIFANTEADSTFVNEAQGVIDGTGSNRLFIGFGTLTVKNAGIIESTGADGIVLETSLDNAGLVFASTGTLTIGRSGETYSLTNSGTIEATGAGVVVIESALENTGTLSVQAGGTLMADGVVRDAGVAIINGGTLDFVSTANVSVIFTGVGTLELGQSQSFKKLVKGFSKVGKTEFDLRDIGFVSGGEATYSGTSSSGVLTVTDGTHTANITLNGDYLGSTFVASSDGNGGVIVVAQHAKAPATTTHAFVAAMAGLGSPSALATRPGETWSVRESMLTSPRTSIA